MPALGAAALGPLDTTALALELSDLSLQLFEVLNEQTADANGGQYTFASLIAGACRTRLKEGQQQ